MKPPDRFELELPGRAKITASGFTAMVLALGLIGLVFAVGWSAGLIRLP
jgi:hypothetical protein